MAVQEALATLGGLLSVSTAAACPTHSVMEVAGLSLDPKVVRHVAVYLVGR